MKVHSAWRGLLLVAVVGVVSASDGRAAGAPPSITGLGFLGVIDSPQFATSATRRYSVASGVSDDGNTVVGDAGWVGAAAHNAKRAFRWTREKGMQNLGLFAGDTHAQAFAVSGDGSMVVGSASCRGVTAAFFWTEKLGVVDLNVYLNAIGVDLTGWELDCANGVTADGRFIVGEGMHDGAIEAWIVDMGSP